MPKSPITRVNGGFQVVSNTTTNPNNGLFAPQLTTAQIAAIPAVALINGSVIYNLSTTQFNVYQNGGWAVMTTVPAATFIVPSAAVDPVGAAGMIYYNTASNVFRVYQNATWSSLYANVTAATGVGLVAGDSPFSLPSGTAAAVEVAGNQVNGFAYYNTTTNLPRIYLNGAWSTIPATPAAATVSGVGLVAGSSPLLIPNGTSAAVEVAANQVNGFIYYNTTANTLRIYFNGGWSGITIP